MFAGMTIYNVLWFFFLYSVLGWIVEVIYHVVACGKIVNRGFLNGPVCPIYGFGMIGVLWMVFLITPEGQDHPGLVSLFLGGMLAAPPEQQSFLEGEGESRIADRLTEGETCYETVNILR